MQVTIRFAVRCEGRHFTVGEDEFPGEARLAAYALGSYLSLGMRDVVRLLQRSSRALEIPGESSVQSAIELFFSDCISGYPAEGRFPGSIYATAGHGFAYVMDRELKLVQVRNALGQSRLKLYLLISGDAGEVLRGKVPGVTFSIRSNEAGSHHLPHVHVCYDHCREWAMAIQTREVLAGREDYSRVPGKTRRQIVRIIEENASDLMDYWNNRTNGMRFDVDAALGQIDCAGLN